MEAETERKWKLGSEKRGRGNPERKKGLETLRDMEKAGELE